MLQGQEQRHVYYDQDLKIEAYNLSGIVQKFPNHFSHLFCHRLFYCDGRNLPDQLSGGIGSKAESDGRYSGSGCRSGLGRILHDYKKNQHLWLQYYFDHKAYFFYGLILMIPVLFGMDFGITVKQLLVKENLFNLLFLGLGASALCFVTWNLAVKSLGSVKTSVYIYMVPIITAVTSALIPNKTITKKAAAGILLALAGLLLSESKKREKSVKNRSELEKKDF